jgi:hypothetical protein
VISGVSYGWSVQEERIHWFGKRFWERGQAEDLHWLQPTVRSRHRPCHMLILFVRETQIMRLFISKPCCLKPFGVGIGRRAVLRLGETGRDLIISTIWSWGSAASPLARPWDIGALFGFYAYDDSMG